MQFVGASTPGLGRRDTGAGRKHRAPAWIAAAIVVLLALPACSSAAPVPTVLSPVAAGVPGDGRAWELVTPGEVAPIVVRQIEAVARGGNRLVYWSLGTLESAENGGALAYAIAERTATGWISKPIDYPVWKSAITLAEDGPAAFTPELTNWLSLNYLASPSGELTEERRALYRRQPDGSYTELTEVGMGYLPLVAASEDLQRAFFQTELHLLPGDAARVSGQSLYEVEGSTLHLADVNEDGSLVSDCGSTYLATTSNRQEVFFSAAPACDSQNRIYMRAGGRTTEISASQCTLADCGPEAGVSLAGLSRDSSSAYLETSQRLTDAPLNAGEEGLYRYDIPSGKLTLLLAHPQANLSIAGASEDGSRVYFLSNVPLLPEGGTSGGHNLYLESEGHLRFLATLWQETYEDPIEVSADGRYVVFSTATQLSGEDSDEVEDVYRYDARTGDFKLLSGGIDGLGNGPFQVMMPSTEPNVERSIEPSTDIGQHVFFATSERLVPQDRNEVSDVYEWSEAGGLGLVSAGAPGLQAEYAGRTIDGGTVFFSSRATLLPRDRDGGENDIYAARVGGGFDEPNGPAACAGETCEAAPAGSAPRALPAGKSVKPRLALARVDAATGRQLAATGRATLLAEVPVAGRLLARGKARIGSRRETALTGAARVKRAGPVRLHVQLTQAARDRLAHGQDLHLRLVLSMPKQAPLETGFSLRGAR